MFQRINYITRPLLEKKCTHQFYFKRIHIILLFSAILPVMKRMELYSFAQNVKNKVELRACHVFWLPKTPENNTNVPART